jgi:hypothetical protein
MDLIKLQDNSREALERLHFIQKGLSCDVFKMTEKDLAGLFYMIMDVIDLLEKGLESAEAKKAA